MTKALSPAQKAAKKAIKVQTAERRAAPAQRRAVVRDDNGLDAINQDQVTKKVMPDNDTTMHAGVHDTQDALMHFEGEVHDIDAFPENWLPPSELDAPPEMPNMVQRWIRMSIKGQNDGANLTAQAKNGWRPRALDSVPEGSRKNYSTMKDPRSSGQFIVNGDLVLCHMPKRLFDQMQTFFDNKRKNQVQALVDDGLKKDAVKGSEKHGFGAPHVEHRHTEVRTDRVPIVAADR